MSTEVLQQFDADMLLAINGAHSAYFDSLMWLITRGQMWLPMILVLLLILFRNKGWRAAVAALAAIAVVVLLTDQISASIIKPLVARPRPTHNEDIGSLVHAVNGYRGGAYGFVSSHAANCFGIASLLALMLKNRITTWVLIVWAALMCYSRMYLGVHYPGDIACGTIIGVASAFLVNYIYKKFNKWGEVAVNSSEARQLLVIAVANLLLLAAIAPFLNLN